MSERDEAGWLSTHVLDTALGRPAAGLVIKLFSCQDGGRALLATATTNQDGRTDQPILGKADFRTGDFELVFHAGDYLRASGRDGFYDLIPVRFQITDSSSHYHVPLLLAPFGYSTYRGS